VDRLSYEIEAGVEKRHWWFRGRRRILRRLLGGLEPPLPPRARILDVGCGTGANAEVLAAGERFVVGLDASAIPLELTASETRRPCTRLQADAGQLPFPDAMFDLVAALDVLEHMDDDVGATHELARVLKPAGVLIVFVPALRALWSLQDEVSHHRRRYGRDQLRTVVLASGLHIERLTFFNTLLFPPILAARLAMRIRRPRGLKSENQLGGPLTNALLTMIFAAEGPVVSRVDLPIGVSLACVARRPDGCGRPR
jgi:SAM-dependent methyltransferase